MTIDLSIEYLLTAARKVAESDDFGGDSFTEGLEVLIKSLENDVELYEPTREYYRGLIIQILVNRLNVAEWYKNHPEIAEEVISAPIFITGLPRTGTTILHTLIALDPASRFLRNWESVAPCPPPEFIYSDADPRIQSYHEAMEGLFQLSPDLKRINGLNFISGGTAECQNLLAHEFINFGYSAGHGLETYGRWLSTCDMSAGYVYHKKLLKLLQWRTPNERWVLKAPMHLFGLEALFREYPDARIVFTHRDPVKSLASGASMVGQWSMLSSPDPESKKIGDWWPEIWEKGIEKALKSRDHNPHITCFDLQYQDMVKDPINAVYSIYEAFNLPVTTGHDLRMKVWLRDNPQGKYGRHTYGIDAFGLDPDKERKRFSRYQERFGIPVEGL